MISGHILDELSDVLRRKFDWPESDLREVRRQFRMFGKYVLGDEALDVVKGDPDDNYILAAAAECDYIVSGDHHLLELGSFRRTPIVKVAEFLEMLERGRSR